MSEQDEMGYSMDDDNPTSKKMMFVMRKAPHGTIYSYEGLEVVLITASYDQDVTMLFIDDGVFALKNEQNTEDSIGIKGFMKTYGVLEHYDVEKLIVDKESMEERGLTPEDFSVDVEVIDRPAVKKMMEEQDVLFPF